jgi:hypothetical protein
LIASLASEVFERLGHTWKIGGTDHVPTEEDVRVALDKAASILYSMKTGERIVVGGLIIEKRDHNHDVYIYLGNYK